MRQLLRGLPRAEMPQLMRHRLLSALRTPAPTCPQVAPPARSEQPVPGRASQHIPTSNVPLTSKDRRTS